jgi:hypothetical protein
MAETDQEVAPSYTANPNQKVYDTAHVVDHEVNVLDIYFAEKVKKYKWTPKEETYTVKGGGNISDVVDKYKKKTRRNISTDPNPTTPLKKGDVIKVTWEEQEDDGFEIKKINKIDLGKKIFIIANCTGTTGKLEIELHENVQTEKEAIYDNPVKFLITDAEKTKIEFTIVPDKSKYEQEITLRPKDDKDLEKLEEKYNKRTEKKAFLFFKATVTGTEDTIVYPNNKNEFQNVDGERLTVKNCDCGKRYRKDIACTKYGKSTYGPVYWGTLPLGDYTKWADLVANNTVTEDEKNILIAMSENEGKLDAVQSYDSEIITAGAMQKTINPEGYGELPIQMWEFKTLHPEKYACYVENCKWLIEEEKTERKNAAGVVISTTLKYKASYDGVTAAALKAKIRAGFEASKYGSKVECKPMEPIINLMKDDDYQIKQIKDFIKRLNSALDKTPTGYSYKISDFVKSNLGKATVLDHDVNRPGHVANCFGEALDGFFKANSKVSKNPADWDTKFADYETKILEIYGPLRGTGSYSMTNASKRYTDLKAKL